MGQSRGGGYQKMETMTPGQQQFQQGGLAQAMPWLQQAAQGYGQFLPGGGGGQAMQQAAQQRFQQQTIPSIMSGFGSGAKTSSALNQALAAGGANMQTDLASQLAQMQMQAAGGMAGLGSMAGQVGMEPAFAYQQKATPWWQDVLGQLIGAGGQMGASALMGHLLHLPKKPHNNLVRRPQGADHR